MNWNVIKWEDGNYLTEALEKYDNDSESAPGIWETLAERAGVSLDKNGNMPTNWTWEDSYKIGLPKAQKDYLCYFKEDDYFQMCHYDDENNTPCFWFNDYPEICYPDAWCDLSKENPLGE